MSSKLWPVCLLIFLLHTILSPVAYAARCTHPNMASTSLSFLTLNLRDHLPTEKIGPTGEIIEPLSKADQAVRALFERMDAEAQRWIWRSTHLDEKHRDVFLQLTRQFLREWSTANHHDQTLPLHWNRILGYVHYSPDPIRGMLSLITGLRLLQSATLMAPTETTAPRDLPMVPLTIVHLLQSARWVQGVLQELEATGHDIHGLEQRLAGSFPPEIWPNTQRAFQAEWTQAHEKLRPLLTSAHHTATAYVDAEGKQTDAQPPLLPSSHAFMLGASRAEQVFHYTLLVALGFPKELLFHFGLNIDHDKLMRFYEGSLEPINPKAIKDTQHILTRLLDHIYVRPSPEAIVMHEIAAQPNRTVIILQKALFSFENSRGYKYLQAHEDQWALKIALRIASLFSYILNPIRLAEKHPDFKENLEVIVQPEHVQGFMGYDFFGPGGGPRTDFSQMAEHNIRVRLYNHKNHSKPWLIPLLGPSFIYGRQDFHHPLTNIFTDGKIFTISGLDYFGFAARLIRASVDVARIMLPITVATGIVPIAGYFFAPDPHLVYRLWAYMLAGFGMVVSLSELAALAQDMFIRHTNPRVVMIQWKNNGLSTYPDWNYHRQGDNREKLWSWLSRRLMVLLRRLW